MTRDGVAVDPRVAAAVFDKAGGRQVNVTQVCRAAGISTKTFYKYVARFEVMGLEGFFPLSRRPHRSPHQTPAWMEDQIVAARKAQADEGWDIGAISVRYRLLKTFDESVVPSRATIHRILHKRGQIVPQPKKAPRSACTRFVRSKANELWQMDGFETPLADGTKAVVLQILDDHSRLDLADHAAVSENAHDAWIAVTTAAHRYGFPAEFLTDNATAFNASRRGITNQLETNLRAIGVRPFPSSVRRPQTCGKNERSHATAQQWLASRPAPSTLAELQQLLDHYRDGYNQRRHQGLSGLTPQQAFDLAEKAGPAHQALPAVPIVTNPTVSPRGAIGVDGTEIGLGRRYRGNTVTVFRTGNNIAVFNHNQLIRTLTLDRTHRYQPRT
jgi:AcrR family transcriptional regulator